MTRLRTALAAFALTLAALPAAAGTAGFDLPRLDFPAPEPVTRDCTPLAAACADPAR